ncbi:trypco2 family protein [Terrabacter sp. NPDC000476]|uniref:trypco2 family protein n=1 Tax=Terrabacter sp. NPDC000476 TaxID=3154258 RepID=UPI0033231FA9
MTDSTNDEQPDGRLPLAEVLAEVADSFRVAKASGDAHPDGHIIGWSHAQLELSVSLTRDGGGKVRAWVVEAGGNVAKADMVKISVGLSPYGTDMLGGGM